MLEMLKSAGTLVLVVAGAVALIAVALLFIYGATYVSVIVMPFMVWAVRIALLLCIFVFLPLSLFHRGRSLAGLGFVFSSFVFGVCTWMLGLLVTMNLWGALAVFIGLGMGGVGVVPIGMLAALFHGSWFELIALAVGIVVTFGVRLFGAWIAEKYENEELRRHQRIIEGKVL